MAKNGFDLGDFLIIASFILVSINVSALIDIIYAYLGSPTRVFFITLGAGIVLYIFFKNPIKKVIKSRFGVTL